MKCPKCQTDNPEGANFCDECATPLGRKCPNCGADLRPSAKFCGECAHDVSAPVTPPADLSFGEKLDKIQRYLPDGLTEKILAQRGKIEGERKQITVVFCDAVGFTPLSERLGPEKVYSVMDEVFEVLIHKVHEYGGTVNKMTGDGIMALFGAPIALEDAPQRAIRSALAIQREISRLSDSKKEETGNRPIRMRIGVHTGPVVVGSLGNDLRVEFTAVGDTVNLASRMEGLAEPGTVYVTEDTFKLTEGLFRFEALGEKEVKGREAPVTAYRVIAPSTRRSRFDVSAERGLTPFLGRERELELLLDGLDRAKSGRGQAFSIMGEAGVGKSRLLYELRKAVANEDVTFLEGRCLSYSTNVAYHPIIDLLKSTFDVHEDDNDDRITDRVKRGLKDMGADEASTLPFILELLSVGASGIDALGLTPEARKEKTLEALRRIVLKGSEMRPLVLAVEDLHWVDNSSEETLKSFLEAISGAQVLLVFTYRPEFVHTWGSKSYHSQVNLMRLSNRETLAMAAHILATEHIDTTLEELVLEKTEGIPFFIEEFLKSLKDLEMIEWRDSGYYLAKDVKDVAIPSTIQDVIMARVDSLPDAAKNVLQTGSAIGREFSCELIKRVTGMQGGELTPHLSALRDSELLYERGIFPQATYIFRHSLTQEVAYDSLLEKRKQEIHERVAGAIEELYPDRIDEFCEMLAHHYSKAGDHEKAFQYLKLAGEKAARSYSNSEAFRRFNQAFDLLRTIPDNDETRRRKVQLALLMSRPMSILGYPDGSGQILDEAIALARELGETAQVAQLCGVMGHYYMLTGNRALAVEHMEMALSQAEEVRDAPLIAHTVFALCNEYNFAGQYSKIVELAPKALDLMDEAAGEFHSISGADFSTYGYALGMLGQFDEAEEYCRRGLELALKQGDSPGLCAAEVHYGLMMLAKGDPESVRLLQDCVRHSEEIEFLWLVPVATAGSALGYCLHGDFATGRAQAEKAIQMRAATGVGFGSTVRWLAGWAIWQAGDQENAQAALEEAVELAERNGEREIEGGARTALGRVLASNDPSRTDEAVRQILEGIDILAELKLRPHSSWGHLFLGELYADTGQKEKALEALNKAEAEFKDMGMDYWLRKTREVLARVQV